MSQQHIAIPLDEARLMLDELERLRSRLRRAGLPVD